HDVQIPPGAIVVPTSPIFGSTALVVDGLLDNKQAVNFLVDTGAGFNNLPYSLAKSLNAGTVLPVGQICGLDGLRTLIGSIKLKSLKLGSFNVNDPVFALQPDKSSKTSAGLFSANSLGILGNPVWSKTRLTIDYRNERLIIEIPPDRQALDNYLSQVDEIDKAYLRNKNIDEAARNYEKLMLDAQKNKVKAVEALCIARLASLYGERFALLKESKWLDLASKEYERAGKLAAESRNKTIEGQILSQWAMLYLNAPRNNTDLISAQNLLKKALTRSPSDASIYAALGSAMLKTEKTSDVPARQMGISLIDRALLLDPSNWQALWAKYKLLESEKKTKDMALLVAQMTRYYPDYPQVKELLSKRQKEAAKEPAKGNAPVTKHGKNK
ncbi:MAG: aspartyl protease family protein, partial [Candidatus Obscuribacterales bacterium]|nr:aspartyl protease family protein [Candidatus Obscuribacterales bacterium]